MGPNIEDFIKGKTLKDIFYLSNELRHENDHFMDPDYKFVNLLHVEITDLIHFTKLKELRDILNSINFDNPDSEDVLNKLILYFKCITYVLYIDTDTLKDIDMYTKYKNVYYTIYIRLISLIKTFACKKSESIKLAILLTPMEDNKNEI